MEQNTSTVPPAKFTANDAIILMLKSINTDDKNLFYTAAEKYKETLAKSGNYYYRLNNLLKEKPLKLVQLDSLSNDIKKLINTSIITDDNVYLNDNIKTLIDELIIEWRNAEAFRFHNLPVRNKILFHGATGNGKTTIAKHIAKLTELPFIEINSDLMIDSHIGSSAHNINKIFNQITLPCVLFWDEIDTIGKKRGMANDSAASQENDRMVNSMLVNIDKLSNDVIFIGATNRFDVLDSAFLRRFNVKFELPNPIHFDKVQFISKMVDYYKIPSEVISGEEQNNLSQLQNFSDIKMALMNHARKYILNTLLIKPIA